MLPTEVRNAEIDIIMQEFRKLVERQTDHDIHALYMELKQAASESEITPLSLDVSVIDVERREHLI